MELEDNYEEWSSERLLAYLAQHDVSRPAGFAIEVYRERFSITDDAIPVLERYLLSEILDNRSAALEALIIYGKRNGYTGDALVLNFTSRNNRDIAFFSTLNFIKQMADRGDAAAKRVWELLERDPFVIGVRQGIERFQSQYGYD